MGGVGIASGADVWLIGLAQARLRRYTEPLATYNFLT